MPWRRRSASRPAIQPARQQGKDTSFGPNYSSLGQVPNLQGNVSWLRLKDLACFNQASIRLFENGVDAGDINQGSLGNCWLLSSLACLATRAGAVEKVFLTREYNEAGRYQLRLWDRQVQQFEDTVIDDFIPVRTSDQRPCFARPTGNEAWVLLLEKAMAKYCGSYEALIGGSPAWALNVLTGHYTCMFLLNGKYARNRGAGPKRTNWRWMRSEPVAADPVAPMAVARRPSGAFSYDEHDESKYYNHDEMFKVLAYHLDIGNLVAASTGGGSDTEDRQGVVLGHAYTVTAAKVVDSKALGWLNLVQLRNPHGAGGKEWTGKWSDGSDMWSRHPEVAAALRYKAPVGGGSSLDGFFWMDFTDFLEHYDDLTFCCANGFDYLEEKEEDAQAEQVQVFKDPAFPHNYTSLGDFTVNGESGPKLDKYVKWCRLKEIAAAEMFRNGTRGLKLFAAGTHPDDIDGTTSGLMVAAACLANKPFAIEELFVSGKLYKPDGAYQIKLYEPSTGKASIEPFDDWIPCFNNKPMTETKILNNEVWVLLLEKAVAKLLGDFVSAMHVRVCWGLACLTGEYTCQLLWRDEHKKWMRTNDMVYQRRNSCSFSYTYNPDVRAMVVSDDVFQIFAGQLVLGCLAAADTGPSMGSDAMGLAGHTTYSILDARHVTVDGRPKRLIQLRDASRQHEWRGDWSDQSDVWKRYPQVAKQLSYRPEASNGGGGAAAAKRDGSFWMPYEEFLKFFRTIYLCGNRLRDNPKPWVVSEEEMRQAREKLDAARALMQTRAEQEALEEAKRPEVKQAAIIRAQMVQGGAPDRGAAATPKARPSTPRARAAAEGAAAGREDAGKAVLGRFNKHIRAKRVDLRSLFERLLKRPGEQQLPLLEVPRLLAAAMPELPKEELWLLMLHVQSRLPYDGGANYNELIDALRADDPSSRPASADHVFAAAPSSSSSSSGRSGASSPARSSSGSSSDGGDPPAVRSPPALQTSVGRMDRSARSTGSAGNNFYSALRAYLRDKKLKFAELFELFDTDHNGTLDSGQLASLVKRFMPGASGTELKQVLGKLGSGPFTLRQVQERLQVFKPSR